MERNNTALDNQYKLDSFYSLQSVAIAIFSNAKRPIYPDVASFLASVSSNFDQDWNICESVFAQLNRTADKGTLKLHHK